MSEDKLSNMVFKPCGHNIEESCWHNNLGKASEEIFRLKSEVEELKNERAALYKSNHAFIETVEQLKSEVEMLKKNGTLVCQDIENDSLKKENQHLRREKERIIKVLEKISESDSPYACRIADEVLSDLKANEKT
jgi:hypothetical protein